MAKDDKTEKKEFDAQAEINRVREEVMAAPAPGTDPDSLQRTAKTLAATPGVDVPDGLSVDPITDKDREASVDAAAKRREALTKDAEKATDGKDEKATETKARSTTPPGRTATPGGKNATGGTGSTGN